MLATTFLSFAKVFGLIVALISSGIAAVMDLKDTRGALTFWGKINFGIIVFGGFLAIAAQLLENAAKQDEALASIRDIQRILHPLSQIKVGFVVQVDDKTQTAKKFLSDVDHLLQDISNNPCRKQQLCSPGKGILIYNNDPLINQVERVGIGGSSSLIPSGDDFESKDLSERALDFRFYKAGGFVPDPKSNDLSWLRAGTLQSDLGTAQPDLMLSIYAKIRDDNFFDLDVQATSTDNSRIKQIARYISTTVWSQTGEISSILDFAGANLVVEGANLLNHELDIKCLEFEIQPGRSIWIPPDKMQISPANNSRSFPLYFVHLPSDLSELSHACI